MSAAIAGRKLRKKRACLCGKRSLFQLNILQTVVLTATQQVLKK
jgi:hypothetical protein